MSISWKEAGEFPAQHCAGLAGIAALSLLSVGISMLVPWPMKLIVDNVLGAKPIPQIWSWLPGLSELQDKHQQLAWLALVSAALFLSVRLVEMARSFLAIRIGRQMQYALGGKLFLHLQRLSPVFHAYSQTGDLVRRVTMDSKCVDEFVVGICIPTVTAILMLVAMFTVIANMSLGIALLALLTVVPIAFLIHILIPKITEQSLAQQNIESQVMSLAETNLSALPIVHAFDRTQVEGERFRTLTGQSVEALARATASEQLFGVLAGCALAFGGAAVLGVGGFQVLNGTLELGSLLVILAYLALLYAPVETLARLSSAFAHCAAKARRAFEILSEQEFVDDVRYRTGISRTPQRAAGAIRFENVSFGYGGRYGTLRDITIAIQPGETVAIVGPTGAGKSTLISLALRLFDPDSGRITLDDVDIREWRIDDLRRQFGLVLQEPYLLPLTVAENIAFGSPDAAVESIATAARAAGADPFIRRLPWAYATRLGERGAGLSGGERQRIAIARALLRDAPILILDEPTAALDVETERELLATVYGEIRNRTTIIIAHRLSTVRAADRILVLDQGQFVESGTHPELLAKSGLYFRLHQQSLCEAL